MRIGACASFGGRDIFYLSTTFSQRNGRAACNLLIQKILKLLCCFRFILVFQLLPHFFYQRFDKVPEQDKQAVCRSQPFFDRWCFQRRVDILHTIGQHIQVFAVAVEAVTDGAGPAIGQKQVGGNRKRLVIPAELFVKIRDLLQHPQVIELDALSEAAGKGSTHPRFNIDVFQDVLKRSRTGLQGQRYGLVFFLQGVQDLRLVFLISRQFHGRIFRVKRAVPQVCQVEVPGSEIRKQKMSRLMSGHPYQAQRPQEAGRKALGNMVCRIQVDLIRVCVSQCRTIGFVPGNQCLQAVAVTPGSSTCLGGQILMEGRGRKKFLIGNGRFLFPNHLL